ncbi:hypothetical protein L249_7379 [Ophiocordyceps polyrhachis-furcata BCC 54312]|uniref:Uncharacterized protein n=1 Tax=Ophiocordyceps polyrhachis-furcata BCC 54312 TaxID=1330021 RepID=A0A367LBM3_9HYPO|nr:hypothetical protein L249_7379 [Ophiocordyceps polyrhachis-furcata BCC 54312]
MLTRRLIDPYIQKIRLPRLTSLPRLPDLPYVPSFPPPTLLCRSYLSSVTYGGLGPATASPASQCLALPPNYIAVEAKRAI